MAGAVGSRDRARLSGVRWTATRDLALVNQIVGRALSSWQVADRVMRLAMPSLHYTATDLEHMEFVLTKAEDVPVAVAAWESDTSAARAATEELLLHGLYVMPDWQRCGIGGSLLQHVEVLAAERGARSVTLHAWRDAETFFRARGFEPDSEQLLYPRRLRKHLRD